MKTQLLSFLFLLCGCLMASAEDFSYTYEGQTLNYTVLDEEAMTCEVKAGTVEQAGNNVSGDLVIPSTVMNGRYSYTVTSIGDRAFYGSGLTSVDIPTTIVKIGKYAFAYCSKVTSVNIHDIAAWCGIEFAGNSSNPLFQARTKSLTLNGVPITELVIPSSVTTIGPCAFYGCRGLTSVDIPNSVTTIGEIAFSGCSGLTSIDIPNSVTTIGSSAFSNCSGLTSVDIPASVTTIGDGAFYGCSALISVNIHDMAAWCSINFQVPRVSLYEYTANPLYCAHNLTLNGEPVTELVIPASVTTIGNYAFSGCSGLTSVDIPASVTTIGNYAFSGCSGLTSVDIPASVTTIGDGAFSGCSGLTSVDIPVSVTSIGGAAFSGCSGLTSVDIPVSVTTIGNYAFSGSGLTSVNIHDIAAWCGIEFGAYHSNPLSYAHNLTLNGEPVTELIIPASVTTIGNYAFSGCSGLTSVDIPASVTTIGIEAFYDCSGLTSVNIHDIAAWCGIVFVAYYSNPLKYAHNLTLNGEPVTELIIPASVTSIGGRAFSGCSGLTSVDIPVSVTTIGAEAFYDCSGLTSVNIHDIAAWCGIEFGAYYSNPLEYAHNLTLNGEPVTELIIPASVTTIGDRAFYGCSGLTSVEIPSSVTSIGYYYAFYECSNLQTIYSANPTPPSIYEYTFTSDHYENATLYVPEEAMSAYQTASYWANFQHVQGFDFSGIGEVQADGTLQPKGCYDLHGRRLSAPQKGLNILNGQKILVR